MSNRGHAWRKGAENTLYLGNGLAGQVLTTEGRAERPVVAIYSASGVLLAARPGHINRMREVVVSWDGVPLECEAVPVEGRDNRAPSARYRATVPERTQE